MWESKKNKRGSRMGKSKEFRCHYTRDARARDVEI